MRAKLAITTRCGAHCATCPVWKLPEQTMSFPDFKKAWIALSDSPLVSEIFVNSIGDVYSLDHHLRYLVHMETCKPMKAVSLTINANVLDFVPLIDHFTISFNGGDKESYERTTGLDFDRVVANIRAAYPQLQRLPGREIDCLVWKGNEGCEEAFFKLWEDFPGERRVSYKVENQFGDYFGLPEHEDRNRIFCDYLNGLTVMPNGQFVRCAHDFHASDNYGNIFESDIKLAAMHPDRQALREAHKRGEYPGICQRCNYNIRAADKLVYRRP